MRKIIFLFIVVLLLASCGKQEQKIVQVDEDKQVQEQEKQQTIDNSAQIEENNENGTGTIVESENLTGTTEETLIEPGFITGDNILCLGNQVEDVDIDTFQLLDYDYAKDKNNLYYCGYLGYFSFTEIDVDTVEIIDGETVKDKNFEYKLGMNGILEKGEKVVQDRIDLGNNFSKDLDFVYYSGKKIDGLDPDSFKMLGYKYIRDSQSIYFMKDGIYQKSTNIDVDTFQVLKDNKGCLGTDNYICYAKDKDNIILNGVPLVGSDIMSFGIIDKFFAKDKDTVYYKGINLENLDGDTFQLVGDDYIKDKKGIYLLNPSNTDKSYIQINEIDLTSFRILENHYDSNVYAMDQYNIYFYKPYKEINYFATIPKTIDSDSLKILGDGYVEDLHYIYYFHFSEKDKKIYSYKLDVDIESVKFIDDIFLKDKEHIYMKNKNTGEHIHLDFVDKSSFYFLNPSYAMDNNNVYYYSSKDNEVRVIECAEWESFETLEDNKECDENIDRYCFGMDDFYIYKYGEIFSSNK